MRHLRLSDRYEIKILLNKKYPLRQIAKALNRSVSTISDEIKRNKKKNGVYHPELAQQKTYVRRRNASYRGKKIVRHDALRDFVERHLIEGHTPEAIAGRLKNQEKNFPVVSKNTIYRFQQSPYGQILNVKKKKRKRKFGYKSKKKLKDRKFIGKRPKSANLRIRIGDTEADFVVSGKNGKGVLLVVVDRKLRIIFLEIIYDVTIANVHKSFLKIKKRFPEMRTLTLDNDILFRKHLELEKLLNLKIYFCDPYSSWQKGTVENVNKYIREYISKGNDLSKYSRKQISKLENILNNRYLKCLNYQTPAEVLKDYRRKQKNNPYWD